MEKIQTISLTCSHLTLKNLFLGQLVGLYKESQIRDSKTMVIKHLKRQALNSGMIYHLTSAQFISQLLQETIEYSPLQTSLGGNHITQKYRSVFQNNENKAVDEEAKDHLYNSLQSILFLGQLVGLYKESQIRDSKTMVIKHLKRQALNSGMIYHLTFAQFISQLLQETIASSPSTRMTPTPKLSMISLGMKK